MSARDLLDHRKFIAQLCNLERRVARGGKDSIDHPNDKKSHDDIANAAAGALVLAASKKGGWSATKIKATTERFMRGRDPSQGSKAVMIRGSCIEKDKS